MRKFSSPLQTGSWQLAGKHKVSSRLCKGVWSVRWFGASEWCNTRGYLSTRLLKSSVSCLNPSWGSPEEEFELSLPTPYHPDHRSKREIIGNHSVFLLLSVDKEI
mmetsp:Transcript_28746/g.46240  ORF Transcript_28746/g.46240 Transcript_28746/m.46240 type:complete len:105 (-) Transcript_28746:181-495(-)